MPPSDASDICASWAPGQGQQHLPVALDELAGQRRVTEQTRARATRALLHDLEADLVASRDLT